MNSIYSYIKESILSSTGAGKYAVDQEIKPFILQHTDAPIESIDVLFDKTPYPCVIVNMQPKRDSHSATIKIKSTNDRELMHLRRISGIYCKHKNKYNPANIRFENINNLQLDLSNWNKDKYHKSYTRQKFEFSSCKELSIVHLPTYFGENSDSADVINIEGDCTIKSLPKELGNTNINLYPQQITRDYSNCYSIIKALEGITFNKLYLSEKIVTNTDTITSIFDTKGNISTLHRKYNEQFTKIVDSSISAQIVLDGSKYVKYDKQTDTYIFDSNIDTSR